MKFNNVTLMVRSDEREGGPQGITLLKIKKGEDKLKLLVNQELDMYSIFPYFEDKEVKLTISMGKLLENGNIEWSSALRLPISIPFKQLKLILGEYHYISTGLINKIKIEYQGEGEYVLRGDYEIDDTKRTTWDYFKIVEEEEHLLNF